MLRQSRIPVLLIVALLRPAFGQDAASPPVNREANGAPLPAFEVASIRPADPAGVISIRRSGDRLTTSSTSLEMLVTWAFDIRNDRLFGR